MATSALPTPLSSVDNVSDTSSTSLSSSVSLTTLAALNKENLLSTSTTSYMFDSDVIHNSVLMVGSSKSRSSEYSLQLSSLSAGSLTFSEASIISSILSTRTSDVSKPSRNTKAPYTNSVTPSFPVPIITTLLVPNASYVSNSTKLTSTLTITKVFTSSKSTVYSTEYSTVIISSEVEPLTTFGYVYTQPYELTDSDSTIPTELPTTVTVTTHGTAVLLSNYATLTMSPEEYKKEVLQVDSKTNKGAIAGGVVGALAGALVMVFLVIFWYKRRQRNPFQEKNEHPDNASHALSDNGLFAMRNSLLMGAAPETKEINSSKMRKKASYFSRNRVIDTVYEESTESLSSRRSLLASNRLRKKSLVSPEPASIAEGAPHAKEATQFKLYGGKAGDRYAHAGLRKYYVQNPFEEGADSLDDSEDSREFEEIGENNNYGYIDRGN